MKKFSIPRFTAVCGWKLSHFFVVVGTHKLRSEGSINICVFISEIGEARKSGKRDEVPSGHIVIERCLIPCQMSTQINIFPFFAARAWALFRFLFCACAWHIFFSHPPPVRKHFFLFNSLIHLQMTSGEIFAVGGWDFDGKTEAASL